MTTQRRSIAYELAGGGLFIALALLAVSTRKLGLVEDPDIGIRVFNIVCGLILAGYGNVVPKRQVRYEPGSDRPARKQACLRFCGRVFTLGGIGYAAVWMLAPLESASFWSILIVAGSLLLVAVRVAIRQRREA